MRNALKTAALFAALAIGTSGAALAQTASQTCPAGTSLINGVCQPQLAANPATPAAGSTIKPYYEAGRTLLHGWPDSAGGDCGPGYVTSAYGNKRACYPAR